MVPEGLREVGLGDAGPLMRLWTEAGLRFTPALVRDELAGMLGKGGDLLLVVERDGRLVASVLGSYDGRRGWIHRLATHPEWRGRGIARAMLRELERRLAAHGCRKANLLIDRDNAAVAGFYAELGYRQDDLIFMERWLEEVGPRSPDPAI
jgi:ribosomal protein S18 acetylase RimI-like enzyme